jgi:hypothetical protein
VDPPTTVEILLAITLGVLAAIVYSLRVLVLLERRIARMDENLERVVMRIAKDEMLIEKKLGIKSSSSAAKPKKRK